MKLRSKKSIPRAGSPEGTAIWSIGLLAFILSPLALADWRNALSGKVRYDYTVLGIRGDQVVAHCSHVWAISLEDAISQISERHPDQIIRSFFKAPVGINLLLAYPCRLARWFFSYRKFRSVELKAVRAVLRIQTRKAILRKMENGRTALRIDIPANASPNLPLPLDPAGSALGLRKTVAMDDHIISANVPSDLSLLAFGIPPAREAESAGGMPKVPKGQGLDDMKGSKAARIAPPWNLICNTN